MTEKTQMEKGAETRLMFDAELDKRILRCLRDALQETGGADPELAKLRSTVKHLVWERLGYGDVLKDQMSAHSAMQEMQEAQRRARRKWEQERLSSAYTHTGSGTATSDTPPYSRKSSFRSWW